MNIKDKIVKMIMSNDIMEQRELCRELSGTKLKPKQIELRKSKVKSVKKVRTADNEYVYDIGMKNSKKPWYFGNNMLIHNSCYFSAYPEIKKDVEAGLVPWTKDSVIELYDTIAEQMNDTFPTFALETFNVPLDRSTGVIAAGREVIARTGLFIKKKRYAALVYDDEGTRKDVGGKEGKIKVIGLDLRRADCPVIVKDFLMEILNDLLSGKGEEEIIMNIREFKMRFEELKSWDKGVPKAVNGMTRYAERMLQEEILKKKNGSGTKGFTVPGHVRGSMNWNMLRQIHNDLHTLQIVDTQKIVLCYLKQTADNKFTSISYPIDEPHLPTWFTSLPFDDNLMLEKIVDQKIGNLLNVMKWDLSRTSRDAAHVESLFDFNSW